MTGQDFVAAAMRVLETDSPSMFAQRIGLAGYEAPKRVRRWLSGETNPDYDAVMAILAATGFDVARWFQAAAAGGGLELIDGDGEATAEGAAAGPPEALAVLREGQAAILAVVSETAERLALLEQQLSARGAARR